MSTSQHSPFLCRYLIMMESKLDVLIVGSLGAVGKNLLEVLIKRNALVGLSFAAHAEKGINLIVAQKPHVVIWEIECTMESVLQLDEMRKQRDFVFIIFSDSTEIEYRNSHPYLKQYTFLNKQLDSQKLPNLIMQLFYSKSENSFF